MVGPFLCLHLLIVSGTGPDDGIPAGTRHRTEQHTQAGWGGVTLPQRGGAEIICYSIPLVFPYSSITLIYEYINAAVIMVLRDGSPFSRGGDYHVSLGRVYIMES